MKVIDSYGLTAGSLYKFLFIGLLIPLFILAFSCGIASFFGYETVTFNSQHVYGLKGLLVGSMIGIILPLFMAAFLWCFVGFGILIWTRFKKIKLCIKD